MPEPVSGRMALPAGSLEVTSIWALAAPAAVGLKVTVNVTEIPGPSVYQSASLEVNMAACAPVTWMLLVCRVVVPTLSTVKVLATLWPTATAPKSSEVGVNCARGPPVAPSPESATLALDALEATERTAERVPDAAGLKTRETEADAPAAIWSGMAGADRMKSPVLAPATLMEETLSAAVPVLLSCTLDAALDAPTATSPKATEAGATLRLGAVVADTAVPVSVTVRVPRGSFEVTRSEAVAVPAAVGL